MRVAIVIPDRGDRPEFMKNCHRMINAQTIRKNVQVIHVNQDPADDKPDITKRYRLGYKWASDLDVDVIALMENDDWYSPDYLEYTISKWEEAGRPDLFGPRSTIYYHIGLKKYYTMWHDVRASAMNTLIRPGMTFNWPLDEDPYTDQWLWMRDNGIKVKTTFKADKIVCMGMKHGVGKCGGEMHTTYLHRFDQDDNGFLVDTLDPKSYQFYRSVKI